MSKNYWGQGLATEAARAALHYGFNQLGLSDIIAVVEPANIASVTVFCLSPFNEAIAQLSALRSQAQQALQYAFEIRLPGLAVDWPHLHTL